MGGGSWKVDAEFKFAKIQKSHVEGGWMGGWGAHGKLMLSSNLLKSKIHILGVGGWGGGVHGNQFLKVNFKFL